MKWFLVIYCNIVIYCNTLEGNMQYGDQSYCFTPNGYVYDSTLIDTKDGV